MSERTKSKTERAVCWLLFLCYIAALVYFLFFSESYGREGNGTFRYNLVPLQEIMRFWKYRAILGNETVILNLAFNVIGFMPFGFMLPLLSEKDRRFVIVFLLTFELSLVVEVLQLFTGRGSFDVDDLMLNTLGGVVGYGCYCVFARLSRGGRR